MKVGTVLTQSTASTQSLASSPSSDSTENSTDIILITSSSSSTSSGLGPKSDPDILHLLGQPTQSIWTRVLLVNLVYWKIRIIYRPVANSVTVSYACTYLSFYYSCTLRRGHSVSGLSWSFVYTISYKPLVRISLNLQLRCRWRQRWTD